MFGRKKEIAQGKNQLKPVQTNVEPEKAPTAEATKKVKPEKKAKVGPAFEYNVVRSLSGILDGSFLTKESVLKLIPFFGFLTLLALLLITNNYVAQRRIKEIDATSQDLKELHDEYISTKSELMYHSKMSEIAKKLEVTGVKESVQPPKKIIIYTKKAK